MNELKLHDYQMDGRNWVITNPYSGLFLPPGLGKTAIMLSAVKILLDAGVINRVLIIAPLRVTYMVWPKEIEKWGFNFSVGILHGKNKDDEIKKKHQVYVMNPEGIPWLHANHTDFLAKNRVMLICDESTLFKNHSSQRFKLIKSMLNLFVRRVILTGTPAPNGLIQLWPQVFILDRGKRLGYYITHYRTRWFNTKFSGFGYDIRQGADEEIYEAVNDIIMHKSNNELTLPDKLFNTISVQLTAHARQVYSSIKSEFAAEIGDEEYVTAINAASQASKLKQIANGILYGEDKKQIEIHSEKLGACNELIESLGGKPVLIVYEFIHDLQRLKEYFNAPHIGGGVSGKELDTIITKWNKGQIPVLLIQPSAAGHGLNLQDGGCSDVVWYSITFDLELYEQVNARVHRQGVKNNVTIHHIVAENTVDEKIMTALSGKAKLQDALLASLLK